MCFTIGYYAPRDRRIIILRRNLKPNRQNGHSATRNRLFCTFKYTYMHTFTIVVCLHIYVVVVKPLTVAEIVYNIFHILCVLVCIFSYLNKTFPIMTYTCTLCACMRDAPPRQGIISSENVSMQGRNTQLSFMCVCAMRRVHRVLYRIFVCRMNNL